MKKKDRSQGINLTGSLRSSGVTFYQKQGKTVMRSSTSYHKKGCTRGQFVQRQRMRHTMALWKTFQSCKAMFTEHSTVFLGFASMANRLPAVYVTDDDARLNLALLMPDIPVSEGTMTPLKQHLGEVNGVAALVTDLNPGNIKVYDRFWLYTAEQFFDYRTPKVNFNMREVKVSEMIQTETGLALVGEEYADENKGWALVHVRRDRCTSQGIVTRCTLYQQYMTDEALETAIKSYGKLVRESYWVPRVY